MQEIKAQINTGTGEGGLTLTVVDEASGLVVLRTTLTHQQLGRAVMGYTSLDKVTAFVLDDHAADRIGKQAHTFQRRFRYTDPAVIEGLRIGKPPPQLLRWEVEVRVQCWTHSSNWSVNNNRVVTFSMTRYENDLGAETYARVRECLNATEPPEGLVSL